MLPQASPSSGSRAGSGRPARPVAVRAGSAPAVAIAAAVATAVHGALAGLVRAWRIRRTIVALERLDDRTLADIGLDRLCVRSTARSLADGLGVDPRHGRRDG